MRKLALTLFVILMVPAVPAVAGTLQAFEETIAFLVQSLDKLNESAAELRVMGGVAKEEGLAEARSQLSALNETFETAREQAAELERESGIEKWRTRTDRVGDVVEAYRKEQELKRLEVEYAELQNELCGPRDLYRFDGSCPAPAPVRPYGEPIPKK